MIRLSPHFLLEEFTRTNTGIDNSVDNKTMLANLKHTALGMEWARSILGNYPIIINSGYRNMRVNNAVGGVYNSDHALGYATDFRHSKLTARKAAIKLAESDLIFDQLILERDDTVIHLSFNPRYRMQVLRQPGGPGTAVYNGLK